MQQNIENSKEIKFIGNKTNRTPTKKLTSNSNNLNQIKSNSKSKSDRSNSSSSSSSLSIDDNYLQNENNKYKKLFSFKISNKSESTKPSNQKRKIDKPIPFHNVKKNFKLSDQNKSNNKKLILPPAKIKLNDKQDKINFDKLDDNFVNIKYTNLINPDNIAKGAEMIKDKKEIEIKKNEINKSKSDKIEINQNDIIDKDWERKYIDNLNKKEINDSNIQDQIQHVYSNNEFNIKRIINDYNTEKIQNNQNESEYKTLNGKISTKSKYGW